VSAGAGATVVAGDATAVVVGAATSLTASATGFVTVAVAGSVGNGSALALRAQRSRTKKKAKPTRAARSHGHRISIRVTDLVLTRATTSSREIAVWLSGRRRSPRTAVSVPKYEPAET
jgi:hypothetical protein